VSRHEYACRVRFSDVDVYGHVNNVKYFEYYQEARLAFMSSLGRDRDPGDPAGFSIVVARLDVDYKRPILFRSEPYRIESWVSRVGTSSFDLAAQIMDGDALLSRAHAVLVAFDLAAQAARPLTDDERKRLESALEP
jgi:acyl-CoA thioester hydrolase